LKIHDVPPSSITAVEIRAKRLLTQDRTAIATALEETILPRVIGKDATAVEAIVAICGA
jgi:hypothetical protein